VRLTLDRVGVTIAGRAIVDDVSLDVGQGERLAVLGPSGSGKTTILRVAAGLQRPSRGGVLLDGRDVTDEPPHARRIGLVFQDGALFPHLDVAGNVGFGLRVAGLPERDRAARVAEALELVGLPGSTRRDVTTLSGGEAQRVALARALAPQPDVLLLDEPLGALDGPLRDRLQADLRTLFDHLGLPVIHVTHDVGEAFALGHHVAVLRDGRLAQTAAPDDLWAAPADEWVARFLGFRNVVPAGEGMVAVTRPEAVSLRPGEDGVVASTERRGSLVLVRVSADGGHIVEAVTTAVDHPQTGDRVSIVVDPAGVVRVPAVRPPARA